MEIIINVNEDNRILKEILKENLSRKIYRHIFGYKCPIYLNDNLVKSFIRVNKGDIIKIIYDINKEIEWELYESKLDIYYEDNNYLVLYKRKNLLTIPKISEPKSLYQEILYYLKNKNEELHVSILNRLDKDTEGLILVAKNTLAASLLSPVKEKIKRKYVALLEGILDNKEGLIEINIKKENENSIKRIVADDGKCAITKYKVLKESNNRSLVEFILYTGRTHQIRVTSKYLSHPIVGDNLYGNGNDLHLLSYYLSFNNPFNNKNIEIELELPKWL